MCSQQSHYLTPHNVKPHVTGRRLAARRAGSRHCAVQAQAGRVGGAQRAQHERERWVGEQRWGVCRGVQPHRAAVARPTIRSTWLRMAA